MKRRALINDLAMFPFIGGAIGNRFPAVAVGQKSISEGSQEATPGLPNKKNEKSIYDSIGVRSAINGRGTVTIIGASRMLPEVEKAMRAATRNYVHIDDLMDGVAKRLAELTGAEWGIVTTGATGALIAGCAGIVTGGNPDCLWKLPDLAGMRNEVIIPTYSWTAYESAVKGVGVKMVEVANLEELRAALSKKTAMILVLAGEQSENGSLSIKAISSIVKPLNIPILVDAAAEGLFVPNPHLSQGADLVAYSGGKYLNGPQCSGLLIGRKDLIKAAWVTSAPHHGFGRGYKVGREEIIGMLTAVEMWAKRDHVEEFRKWASRLETIAARLKKIPGVTTEMIQPKGRSNPSPDLLVQWDPSIIPLTGYDVENTLWEESPRIAVSGAGSYLPFPPNFKPNIVINSSQLEAGEENTIADSVYRVLSNSPFVNKDSPAAAFDINGAWDLEIVFAASMDKQKFLIEQHGSKLMGSHFGSYASSEISGNLFGSSVLIRSAYAKKGVRLNFEFTGNVSHDKMEGEVRMGEYGLAQWTATRAA